MVPFGDADWDNDRARDLLARAGNGDLILFPGTGGRRPLSTLPVKIGNGWAGFTAFGVGDWDRDGKADIVTRNDTTGDLMIYPGQGQRAYSSQQPVKIGNGWMGFTSFGLVDWDRDGNLDIITRNDQTGDLMLYPGDGRRAYSSQQPVKIGNGWNGFTFFGAVDWDRDGFPDIITRNDATGDLMLYPGEGRRAYSQQQPVKIGNGWNGFTFFAAVDWDGDGFPDIVTRNDATGDLMVYPGVGKRAYSPQQPIRIGRGF